jgi:triacylglycerol esterase/lipase EstA (alpha/beta hydrolase family)
VFAAVGIAWLLVSHTRMAWPWALLMGVAAGFVVHALIIAMHFALATVAASPTPPEHQLGTAAALACYAGEVAASIRTFSVAQPWLVNSKLAGQRSKTQRPVPVLLLHGFFCNRGLWRSFARTLDNAGHATAAINLEPTFGSIDLYAPLIDHAVRRLRQRTGATKVALVCHSMGGLAARAYLRANGSDSIAKVITLGTPHQGTYLAKFGHGTNAWQMRELSLWLRELRESETPQGNALFTVMLTHHDNIVSPQATQTLPGAKTFEFSGMGHVAMLYNTRVQATVVEELRKANS